jgi:hypothetical protein
MRGRRLALLAGALIVLPLAVSFGRAESQERGHWSTARRDSAGIAPLPAATPEAVVQVYAARTYGWRGAFAVHTWISVKPAGAVAYTRYEVIGWRAYRGGEALSVGQAIPDGYWFGAMPELLKEFRGEEAAAAIPRIVAAVAAYPNKSDYTMWPGPNSNTFTAFVSREAELGVDLPPTAIGKDYIPGAIIAMPPGGPGVQLSFFGLVGLLIGWEEGIEVNLLGLAIGFDWNRPALRLPGIGRIGF